MFDQLLADALAATSPTSGRTLVRARARGDRSRARRSGIAPVAWSDAAYPVGADDDCRSAAGAVDARRRVAALERARRSRSSDRARRRRTRSSVAERLAADLAARGLVDRQRAGARRRLGGASRRAVGGGVDASRVLGSGVDVVYPPRARAAGARHRSSDGAVVSELVPGTPPLPQFFPLRNRIISGLSRAVVVIEAGEKSGSLITARCALEQGRDVLAVPGNVLSGRNRGAHALLRDGAKIVESADDILEELRDAGRPTCIDARRRGARVRSRIRFSRCLTPGEPSDLDAIAERSGPDARRVCCRGCSSWNCRGWCARVGGGRFVRVDRTC